MMSDSETPQRYIERSCRDFAAKVWNEALSRAIERVHQADNYRDAAVRIEEMKISRE